MAKIAKNKKATPRRPKATDGEIAAQRAKAYADMEPHLCDVVRMGEIASMRFDNPDQGLFVFAVTHLEDMLLETSAPLLRCGLPIMKRRRRSIRKRNRRRWASHATRLRC